MNKNSMVVAIIGLLVGVIITGFAAGQLVNTNNVCMMRMMGIKTAQVTDHSAMSMDDMTKQLNDKRGDESGSSMPMNHSGH